MKKFLILAMFLLANQAWSYIDSVRILTLSNGRELILMFDAYKGYTREWNQVNAVILAKGVQNLALKQPELIFDFSYEDGAVYDVGTRLSQYLGVLEKSSDSLDRDSYLSLVPPMPGVDQFSVMAFKRPEKLSTLLAGDLSSALAILPGEWPSNLIVRSNDPRREHFLALTHDQTWLKKHGARYSIKSLLSFSPLLKNKLMSFQPDPKTSQAVIDKLQQRFAELRQIEKDNIENFASFASLQLNQDISVEDLNNTITESSDTINLDLVNRYLMNIKKVNDIYSDGPVIDVLLSLFSAQGPDKLIVVLGNHLALRLDSFLQDMKVIDSRTTFDADFILCKFFSDN